MNWKTVALGDVCSIVNGGTPKSEVAEYWDGNLNWITPKEMGKLLSREISSTERKITDKGMKNSSAKLLPINSVILSSRAPIGHLAINKNLMATNQGCKGLVPSETLNHEYLYYFLTHSKKLLNDMGSGATFKELSGSKLATVEIPLPPLPIQQKIVAKLDAIFAEIEKATAAAEANVKNAEALFQSYLTQVFEHGGEGWQRMEMGRISKVINGYAFKSTDFNSDSGVKCLKITNVGIREFVGDTNEYLPNSFAKNHSNFLVKEGSIVIPLTRTIIGGGLKVAIVPAEFHNSLLNQRVASIEVMPEIIDSELIYYYLSSSIVTNYVLSHVNTLMQPNLSIKDLLSMPVPIPPKKLQSKLKNTISSTIYSIFQIKYLNIKRASECNFLKQSILKQAFNGELVKE